MSNTVIGFFDSTTNAQKAVEQLVQNGFSRDNIDISSYNNQQTRITSSGTNSRNTLSETESDTGEEKESGISRFFKSLFGSNEEEAERFTKLGQQCEAMVTVHAQTGEEAENAAGLLDTYGAIDVDKRDAENDYNATGNLSDGSFTGGRSITEGALNEITLKDAVLADDSPSVETGPAGTRNESTFNEDRSDITDDESAFTEKDETVNERDRTINENDSKLTASFYTPSANGRSSANIDTASFNNRNNGDTDTSSFDMVNSGSPHQEDSVTVKSEDTGVSPADGAVNIDTRQKEDTVQTDNMRTKSRIVPGPVDESVRLR